MSDYTYSIKIPDTLCVQNNVLCNVNKDAHSTKTKEEIEVEKNNSKLRRIEEERLLAHKSFVNSFLNLIFVTGAFAVTFLIYRK